ncbi:MAG TPA: metallophosphoesterase [Candidatus Bathyarchaeia archaeon]
MLTLLLPSPAALVEIENNRTLVIADPHIGWEIALQERGIHVPSQTPKLKKKLVELLLEQKPDALLILGDVKYTVVKAELGEWHDIPNFFTELQQYVDDIWIIRGNHDANLEPLLPESVKLLPATGTTLGDIGFFHGHKWPSPALLKCKTLVMGHVHPVVVFRDFSGFRITRQVWVKAQCSIAQLSKTLLQKHKIKIQDSAESTVKEHYGFEPLAAEIIMMPSYNDFLGGRSINETRYGKDGQATMIGPMARSGIINMETAEIYLLDGTYLGTLSQLRNMQ